MRQVFIFGDSIMRGITYDDVTGRYRVVREARGFTRLSQAGMAVAMHAHMGRTVEFGRQSVAARLPEDAGGADMVLGFGGNDCDYDWDAVSVAPEGEHTCKSPQPGFVQTLCACIRLGKARGARVYVANLVPLEPNRYLEWISRGRSQENILSWLGDATELYRWHEYYNRLVEQAARQEGAQLIDVRTPFLVSHRYPGLISADGIHPTNRGHLLVEAAIEDALLST